MALVQRMIEPATAPLPAAVGVMSPFEVSSAQSADNNGALVLPPPPPDFHRLSPPSLSLTPTSCGR